MLERKISHYIEHFYEVNKGALLLTGARQIGKTYSIRRFAEKHFKSFIEINFVESPEAVEVFSTAKNSNDILLRLSVLTDKPLIKGDTLIFFDEVQLFPRARTAIKYLVEDGRYDYIETGSLVSIKKNVENIMIPSEEEEITMFPMDFEEFLWAMGNETLMPLIRCNFEKKREMGQTMHRMAMDHFRQYLIIGGMPQAVAKYIETKDFNKVDHVKRQILHLYRNDIQKYASTYAAKVTRIFDTIPSQLQRHEKKFMLKALTEGARMRDYETSFFWLSDAMIVNMAYNTTEPSIGLGLNTDDTTLKCYMADTGLLISHAFNEKEIVSEGLYRKLLSDKLEYNGGMIVENIVAQMLRAAGHCLYFFSKYNKEKAEERMELDFLIAKNSITTRHNISPIEVKSTSRYTLSSLNKCIAKYHNYLATPYVLHAADIKIEEGITYLPLYMTGLL